MRKRRRLANKMTIMVCAVLIAVSAFFYAPMEASAEEFSDSSFHFDIQKSEQGKGYNYDGFVSWNSDTFDLIDESLDLNQVYKVSFSLDCIAESDLQFALRNAMFNYGLYSGNGVLLGLFLEPSSGSVVGPSCSFVSDFDIVDYGYNLVNKRLYFSSRVLTWSSTIVDFNFDVDINLNSFSVLTGDESETYFSGYNAGYSAGEEAGESNGYSSGYSDGYDAGEQSGYDSGFQAGSDSVDTQSYYDAGYSAGYDAGYSTGYDSGYDTGYQKALDELSGSSGEWGNYIYLKPMQNVTRVGNPFYVSSYALLDMEEYQSGVNGYFRNTVPGTYQGETTISYNIPLSTLNNNSPLKIDSDSLNVRFEVLGIRPILGCNLGGATVKANLFNSKIQEIYVLYNGHKFYGNYDSGTSYADFNFMISGLSGDTYLSNWDMTLCFVLQNTVTLVTDEDVSRFVSAEYTPNVSFELGRETSNNAVILRPYYSNDRISANIQNQKM